MDRNRQQYGRNQRYSCRSSNACQNQCDNNENSILNSGCNICNNNYSAPCNSYVKDCDCPGAGRDDIKGMALAMAYVPWQQFGNLYNETEAIYCGTIFADLDKHFYGVRCE